MINNIMIIGSIMISVFILIFSIISITYTYTKNKYKQSEPSTGFVTYNSTTETFVWLRELFDIYGFHLLDYEKDFISYQTFNEELQFINIIGEDRGILELALYLNNEPHSEKICLSEQYFEENERLVMKVMEKYFPSPKS